MSETLNSAARTIMAPAPPKCLTPKRLVNIAADALARRMLPDILLPLQQLFSGILNAQLDELKALKTWYWSDMRLGSYDSKVRQLMSKAFIDALDHQYLEPSFNATRGFAVQLLFCCEAGQLETMIEYMVEYSYCCHLIKLVKYMAPLYITGLHDSCLYFPRPVYVLGYIMENSPYLKYINIMQSLSNRVLWDIITRCRQVQVLKLDVYLPIATMEEFVNCLTRAFFNGLNSDQVRERYLKGEPVPITFGNLKHFHLRYDVLPGPFLIPFLECVVNCYHCLTIQFGDMIAWPFAVRNDLKVPLLCPSLIIDILGPGWKRLGMFFWSRELADWKYIIEDNCADFHAAWNFILRSLERFDQLHGSFYAVDEVKFIYCRSASVYSIANIHESLGAMLKELFVYGLIQEKNSLVSLIQNLNACPNLKKLHLSLVFRSLDEITDLKPLNNLQSLCVNINSIAKERESEIQEEREFLKLFLPLLRAAPNLEMLEMPGSTCLSDIAAADVLPNLLCLSLRDYRNLPSNVLVDDLGRLRSLSVLIINRTFGYSKYVILKRMLWHTDLKVLFKTERLVES